MKTPHRIWVACLAVLLGIAVGPSLCAAGSGQIHVTTDPEACSILCDGIIQESSPVTITNLDAGLHLVIARKNGYVECRKTVELAAGQKVAVEMKAEPILGLVLVHSTPPGASIEIAGAYRGTTPLLLTDLPVGKYRLKATVSGYAPREMEFGIMDRVPIKVQIDLLSNSARLHVESEPPGATVLINGVARGTTPCDIDQIQGGDNDVELQLDQYSPYKQRYKLHAGDTLPLSIHLKPTPATLSVASVPPGAQVYLDDQPRGTAPAALEVSPGEHALRLEIEGYEPDSRTVTVARSEKWTQEIRLTRNSGALEIVTEPAGVHVLVDHKDRGVTKAAGSDVLSDPLRIDLLAKGDHQLQLIKKTFMSLEKTFTIEANKTVPLHEILKRQFIADTVVKTKAGEFHEGVVKERMPNGDVILETKPGIFLTIKAADVVSVDPLATQPKE